MSNARDDFNRTALHEYLLWTRVDLTRFLLACGASPQVVNGNGRAPIDLLTSSRFIKERARTQPLACLLFAAGAKQSASDYDPGTLASEIAQAKRLTARERVDLIRGRVFEICTALHNLRFPALTMCSMLEFACEPFSHCVKHHNLWDIVVCVRHFRRAAC